MRKHRHLSRHVELTEELPFTDDILSGAGRNNLVNCLTKLITDNKSLLSLYTFEPYHIGHVFLVDTYSVPLTPGGDANDHVRSYDSLGPATSITVCLGFSFRIAYCGISANTGQSLAIMSQPIEFPTIQPSQPMEPVDHAHRTSEVVQSFTALNSELNRTGRSLESLEGREDTEVSTSRSHLMNEDAEFTDFHENKRDEAYRSIDLYISCPSIVSINNGIDRDEHAESRDLNISVRSVPSINANSDISNSDIAKMIPDGAPYKGNASTPVFPWTNGAYTREQLVKILLAAYKDEYICTTTQLNVANNVAFLIHKNSLEKTDDTKCDDMGSWKNNGALTFYFTAAKEKFGQLKIIEKKKIISLVADIKKFLLKQFGAALSPLRQLSSSPTNEQLRACHKVICPDLPLVDIVSEYKEASEMEQLQSLCTKPLLSCLTSEKQYPVLTIAIACLVAAKPHSADVERLISTYNKLKTSDRSSLSSTTLRNYLHVVQNMSDLDTFDPSQAALDWITDKERRARCPEKAKQQSWFVGVFKEAEDFRQRQNTEKSQKPKQVKF
eukprot:gene14618-16132_t